MNLEEKAALLECCRSARKICLACWRYRQRHLELEAAYKEFDKASDEVRGKTDDEAGDIAGSAEAVPRRHDHKTGTSAGTAGNEEG